MVKCILFSWILTKCPLQVMLVAKREILFFNSLHPGGFGDDSYITTFRLRQKIINLLALFQACYLVTIFKGSLVLRLRSHKSLVLRLQVHIRSSFSGSFKVHLKALLSAYVI